MSIIALIPARRGSKGCPGKNLRRLGGKTLIQHAVDCARAAGCLPLITTDYATTNGSALADGDVIVAYAPVIARPSLLAQDDTPMFPVIRHALESFGADFAPDDIIVLLQPTQPFRTAARVREAIALLRESGADSVVSVIPVPPTLHPSMQCQIYPEDGVLRPYERASWGDVPTRRQDAGETWKRDGGVYCFWRKTLALTDHRGEITIYGGLVRPLILEPHETCELDTEADWAAVEARWEREHA